MPSDTFPPSTIRRLAALRAEARRLIPASLPASPSRGSTTEQKTVSGTADSEARVKEPRSA